MSNNYTTLCGVGGCSKPATHVAQINWFSDNIDAALHGHVYVCEQHGNELIDQANAGVIHMESLEPLPTER